MRHTLLIVLCLLWQAALSSYAVEHDTASASVCQSRLHICAVANGKNGAAATYHVCAHGASAIATAEFNGGGASRGGWPLLRVTSGPSARLWPDAVRMHAAGFAEGYLTQPWIAEMLRRMRLLRTPSARRAVRIFAAKQVAAINAALTKRAHAHSPIAAREAGQTGAASAAGSASQSDSFAADASYASLVDLLLAQVEGVVAGYNAARSSSAASSGAARSTTGDPAAAYDRPATLLDLLELNYDGDAFDVVQAADAGMGGAWLPSPLVRARSNGAGGIGGAAGGGVGAGRGPRRRGESDGGTAAAGASFPPGSHAIIGSTPRFAELHAQLEETLLEHHAAHAAADAGSADAAAVDSDSQLHGAAAAAAAVSAVAVDESLPVPVPALGGRMPSSSRDLESWVRLSAAGRCTAAVVAKELAAGASSSYTATAGAAGAAVGAGEAGRDSLLRSLPAGPPGSRVSLWVAHTTWADYLELLRLWKIYDLALDHADVAAAHPASAAAAAGPLFGEHGAGGSAHGSHADGASKAQGSKDKGSKGGRFRASFSSYPGFVTSTDDWYQLSSGLLVTETTTSAVDARVLKQLHPAHGLPTWLRVGVANMLAADGKAWADAFARYNGGTYNCMWLVLDARKVWAALAAKPGSGLDDIPNGSLLVVEQSPLRVLAVDGTPTLRATGLWVSANRPSLAAVRKDLGYPEELPPALPRRVAAALGGASGGTAVASLSSGSSTAPLKQVLAGAVAAGMSDDQRATVEAEAEADETVARLTAEVLVSATRHNEALGLLLPSVPADLQHGHGSHEVIVTADEQRFSAARGGRTAAAAAHRSGAGKKAAQLQAKAKAKVKGRAQPASSLSRFRALEGATAAADAAADAIATAAAASQSQSQAQSQSQSALELGGLFEPSLLHFLAHASASSSRAAADASTAVQDDAAAVLMAPRSKGGEALLLNPLLADSAADADAAADAGVSSQRSSAAALGGAARRRASAALARFREMGGVSADAVVRGAAAAAATTAGLQASAGAGSGAAIAASSAKDAMRFRQTTGDSSTSSSVAAVVGAPKGREHPVATQSTGSGSNAKAASPTAGAAYFSAFNNPRSRILQREVAAIQSAGDMGRLIRLNRWQGDPESQGRPYLAVAARFDLAPATDHARAANGAVDGKVASLGDILALETALTLGPSRDQQPPFDWLHYDGPGYCDSAAPAGSARNCATMRAAAGGPARVSAAGAAGAVAAGKGASNAKPIVDVRSLCTPRDAPSPSADAGAAASSAFTASGSCPVALPCRWTWGWGHVAA